MPEDYLDTEGVFEELLDSAKPYDILKNSPPLKYSEVGEIIEPNNVGQDASFEERIQIHPVPPLVAAQGGKSKKHKKVAKRKTRKVKRSNTKRKALMKRHKKTKKYSR